MNIHCISLGCPRNLVDTEIMLGQLLEAGHTITSNESEADCVVVNTCSFTRPAADESIDTILEMTRWKGETEGRRLIVGGCLPQRYGASLARALPEVDVFLGTGAFDRIIDAARGSLNGTCVLLPRPDSGLACTGGPRLLTTPPHTAYLKIAEGCSGRCTYCIIPKLRGPHRSRPMEEVLYEATTLADAGVKELTLVAQNTTAYGQDLRGGYGLEHLLAKLAEISELAWVRVLYGHPDYITDPLIETIVAHDSLCPYFDIPIQHISGSILKGMGRSHNDEGIVDLLDRIRRKVPGAVLRTTLMVGFPGETERDFEDLLDFVKKVRFDHMGAFMYSGENDLPSNRLKGHIARRVKRERFDRLMKLQAVISKQVNQRYVGATLDVLVDGTVEGLHGVITGRAAFQAPEVDGVIHINQGVVGQGAFVKVKITEAEEYDLVGDMV